MSSPTHKPITVRDIIAHLQTQPQDLEVWWTWDESGEYWPIREPHGRVDFIVQKKRRGQKSWQESRRAHRGKPVFILGHPR